MKKIFYLLTICACITISACETVSTPTNHSVGMIRKAYKDPIRTSWEGNAPRPLTTYIWYPATVEADMKMVGIPPNKPVFIGGLAARNASFPEIDTTYPLIIMSHGTGGAGMQMMWLGRELATQGYIVAAIDHHGNTAAEDRYDARGFRLPWERALDISAVLDQLLIDPKFETKIDKQHIGAVGFSLGGYTVTALAGGIIDFDLLDKFCTGPLHDTTCDDQSEFPEASAEFEGLRKTDPRIDASLAIYNTSFYDKRIMSAVTLAPALGQAFTKESLQEIQIPFLIIGGTADQIAPIKTNAARLANIIPTANLYEIDNAGHYAFLNSCNETGKRFVPVCQDASGVDRNEVHKEAIKQVSDFFAVQLHK